ncbi:hypothetical protein TWF106_005583 [Orbilia oligospora]|uniref:Uncharacterized protein n=1 Tax=Orbilia oligospora TaxID=2813651 RepID=A0A6G1LZG7_ORBOL|nr:hypothetical protein TWF106_005583 [Orbilia oligospora]KAF3208715.1 hypothetical protein TWF191_000575 [Orbilia oligospora]KAF3238347.1 hypothetical protein TWF192_010361 [Orbilia oligospora]
MKFFTVLALAVLPLALASPIEVPEALQNLGSSVTATTMPSPPAPAVAAALPPPPARAAITIPAASPPATAPDCPNARTAVLANALVVKL